MSARAKGPSDYERGVLMSAMGDASCAMTLSRTEAWVRRQRALLSGAAGGIEVVPVSKDTGLCAFEQRRPDAARYARRFHKAGWSVTLIAWLFDAEPEAMAEVLL